MSPELDRPVALVCAMPMELQPLRRRLRLERTRVGDDDRWLGRLPDGRRVVAVVTGMGTRLAEAGTARLLADVSPTEVVVVGITGAVDDATPIGALVVPERVVDHATGREHVHRYAGPHRAHGTMWTTDAITTAGELPALVADGVVALDMETAAIAQVCEQHGVPWTVLRAVSDRATDGSVDEEVFHLSRQDGTPDPRAVLAYVSRHPWRVPRLARMGRASRLATVRAADAALAHLDGGVRGSR